MTSLEPAPYRPSGALNLGTALEPYGGQWSVRHAAHLLRRAGFGGTPEDVARVASLPMNGAVDALVKFPASSGLPDGPSGLPDVAELRAAYAALLAQGMSRSDEQVAEARKQIGRLTRRGYVALGRWWLDRMIVTPAPLQEKMTLFWHGHFACATGQKGISAQEGLAQNQLFRRFALGNVRELTLEISKDPAMLKYLDNARSRKEHPNENYARELMELFTLGIGNYTEEDVRESARAFTGWGIARGGAAFVFNERFHDDGSKQFLGRTGNFNGNDIVSIIFEQPAASRWFARKLLNAFVYNDPEPELIGALAALIQKNSFEMRPVLSTLLRSNVFYSDRAYRALVKSPAEFTVGTYQLLGIKQSGPETIAALNRMGQTLFRPPSVKGWDGGAAWLNSQTMLTRQNFVSSLMTAKTAEAAWMTSGGMDPGATGKAFVATVLQGDASGASLAKLQAYLSGSGDAALGMLSGENFQERLRGAAYLTMAMPAYQLA